MKVGSGAGLSVAVGLPVADDVGAVAVGEAASEALADAVGLAAALGAADSVADVVGAAELLVGRGRLAEAACEGEQGADSENAEC